jgi:tetratricopeptide (TPR) repeat protein
LLEAERQGDNLSPIPPSWCVSRQKWPYSEEPQVRAVKRLLAAGRDREAAEISESAAANPAISAKIDTIWCNELAHRGERFLRSGDLDDARAALDEAVRRARRHPSQGCSLSGTLLIRGTVLVSARQFVEARRDLQEAADLGDEVAKAELWVASMKAAQSLLDENPEQALLDAATTSLDATSSIIRDIEGNEDMDEWSRLFALLVGLMHGRLTAPPGSGSGPESPCDQLAANPYDPLRQGAGVAADAVDTERAIAACDRAAKDQPKEPRWVYQRGRAQQIAGNAGQGPAATSYAAAAAADFKAAIDAGYPMAFYNAALAARQRDGPSSHRDAPRFSEALNRTLYCCWAAVARHLLAGEEQYGRDSVRRVVTEMTLWAAALGSPSSRELLGELTAKGVMTLAQPFPGAVLTDIPPWLRADLPTRTQ